MGKIRVRKNWVVQDAKTGRYLGTTGVEQSFPMLGERDFKYVWVDDLYEAKKDWTMRPILLMLRMCSRLDLKKAQVKTIEIKTTVDIRFLDER